MDRLQPDIYIAAMGRSGSTILANALNHPPNQVMFTEPGFHTPPYRGLLNGQLARLGQKPPLPAKGDDPVSALRKALGTYLEGRKWGFKEVQCAEHRKVQQLFAPKMVLLGVRNIRDIALSFFEKHLKQQNTDRFPPEWVRRYCLDESAGLVRFHRALTGPAMVVRYEDFTTDPAFRAQLAQQTGWQLHGELGTGLAGFNRQFELDRHGATLGQPVDPAQRGLAPHYLDMANDITAACGEYQRHFGYD